MSTRLTRLVLVGSVLVHGVAQAQRPVLANEATFGAPAGDVLVHYATTGADAVPIADANTDGVPDFVAEVAAAAELAIDHYAMLGFRRPLPDGALGGDGRVDIYLRDLDAADGNAGVDSCAYERCVGFAVAENDYAGYAYPSITEGIRSVVPHEVFHLVQYAYSDAQPANWTEGSAVWAVEHLYGDGNGDFERFLPAFITRSYRPFERAAGGFGDAYPYGAALWPYFLEQRFGADVVVAAWTGCDDTNFLEATELALVARGSTLDAAWTELTRWNVFTGPRAAAGGYPAALAWREPPREPAIASTGMIYIEGMSARYVPIVLAARSHVEVSSTVRVAAWLVADGAGLADGIELAREEAVLAATLDAGTYTLVVTGLARGTITTPVTIAITEPVEDAGGCSATHPAHGMIWLLSVSSAVAARRRRRTPSRRP